MPEPEPTFKRIESLDWVEVCLFETERVRLPRDLLRELNMTTERLTDAGDREFYIFPRKFAVDYAARIEAALQANPETPR